MPKWNDEMLQHLTQDQASEVAEDLRSLFANHPDIEVKVSESAIPNTEERTFTIRYSVALWYDNMLVAVFNRPNDLDRFLAVARMVPTHCSRCKNLLDQGEYFTVKGFNTPYCPACWEEMWKDKSEMAIDN